MLLTLGVLAACAGCTADTRSSPAPRAAVTPKATAIAHSPPAVSKYFSPPSPYPGLTWQYQGHHADPDRDFDTIAGPHHCGTQSAAILMGPWPLGHGQPKSLRQYVRDPQHVVSPSSFSHGDRSLLPSDARPTGYSHKTLELWLAASDSDRYVYMVSGNDVEQWPRVRPPRLCA